ncbi:hypothetical protein [Candidatus Magnetaquicoccus inordinatus]|uniref:hypothetical protein n=1 Tax=Candidatus Magnetaquicoccus inordinatus TaxID=2496818 RepID=UPI00102CE2F8|nr:hypothetical protein [Candidatus Magnetaquicoccus inordinatus]
MAKRSLNIPIVEQGKNQVVGSFCATLDAVSPEELTALAELKRLREEAERVKQALSVAALEERLALAEQLQQLRQEASVWRARREQATLEKHVALGHTTLPVRDY